MKRIYLLALLLMAQIAYSADLYDTTNLTGAENIYESAVALNDLLDGMIGAGFILVVFAITFVTISQNTGEPVPALAGSSFITTFAALILLPLGLIGWPIFQGCLVVFAISLGAAILLRR